MAAAGKRSGVVVIVVSDGMHYAAEVDTTAASAEECAEEVARRLGLAR